MHIARCISLLTWVVEIVAIVVIPGPSCWAMASHIMLNSCEDEVPDLDDEEIDELEATLHHSCGTPSRDVEQEEGRGGGIHVYTYIHIYIYMYQRRPPWTNGRTAHKMFKVTHGVNHIVLY